MDIVTCESLRGVAPCTDEAALWYSVVVVAMLNCFRGGIAAGRVLTYVLKLDHIIDHLGLAIAAELEIC